MTFVQSDSSKTRRLSTSEQPGTGAQEVGRLERSIFMLDRLSDIGIFGANDQARDCLGKQVNNCKGDLSRVLNSMFEK